MEHIMKWISAISVVLLAAGMLVGCSAPPEQEAKMLVEPTRWPGPTMEFFAGTSKFLLARGRISSHRRVTVADGVEIDAWVIRSRLSDRQAGRDGGLFESKLTRGTVVLLHPLMAGKAWFLGLGERLADRGWDVVLMDLRGHGYSSGAYTTWGVREKQDGKAVMDELLETEPIHERIYVCGSSMGAGVAIQYAAIDPRCKGVIAIAPPIAAVEVFRKMLFLLPRTRFDKAVDRAGELADFDPADASALAAAQKLQCPLMVVQGRWDMLVPVDQAEAVFDAAETPKKYIQLEHAGHGAEIGRTAWLAGQMDALAAMEGETAPRIITMRLPRADMP